MVRCRHGEKGEFTDKQSKTPVSGMEPASGGVPEQRAVGRTKVPGKWDSGIHLFLLAAEGVPGPERSPGGNLCSGAKVETL